MNAPSPPRVILTDDHTLVRAGIRALLEKLPGVSVVAEAGDGREVLPLVQTHGPDVILMDIAMPGLNGLEATARLANEFPKARVIILSMHHNEEFISARKSPPGCPTTLHWMGLPTGRVRWKN
jgi:DNA-binding NarL/FixJ family response regulator